MTQKPSKAPYQAPKLTEHGTIRSMTRTLANGVVNDANGPASYTS